MEFYKNWLQKNTEANERAKRRLKQIDEQSSSAVPSTSTSTPRQEPIPSTSGVRPSTSRSSQQGSNDPVTPTDLVYEDNDLKLIVKKGFHQRQKTFKLQVVIYYLFEVSYVY